MVRTDQMILFFFFPPSLVTIKRAKCEDPHYGLVDNGGDVYESEIALANGASSLYAFRHLNLHGGGFGSQDLRLA